MQCATCKSPLKRDAKTLPFCSKRCQDIDLGRWFAGSYRIASDEPPDEVELEIARRARDEQ